MSVASQTRAATVLTRIGARFLTAAVSVVAVFAITAPAAQAQSEATSLSGAPAHVSTTPTPDASENDLPVLDVAVSSGGIVHDNDQPAFTAQIHNTTDAVIPAGHLQLQVTPEPIASQAGVSTWLDAVGDPQATVDVASVQTPEVPVGESREVSIPSTLAALQLGPAAVFGVRGIAITLWGAEDTQVASARTSLVWAHEPQQSSTGITPIVPIIASASTTGSLRQSGLYSAAQLTELTSATGELTLLVNAVKGTSAMLGIDPRLIASIRVLGTTAPVSAQQWLMTLETLSNPTFPLGYADASPTLALSAGEAAPLEPTDLTSLLQAEHFPASTPTPTPTLTPDATATPSATTTPTESATPAPSATATAPAAKLPTMAELLEFPYSMPEVAWPLAGTIAPGQLGQLAQWRSGPVVVDGAQLDATAGRHFTVDGVEVYGTDAMLDAAFTDAVTADSDFTFGIAASRVTSLLAAAATETPGAARYVALPRTALKDPKRLQALLASFTGEAWVSYAPVDGPAAGDTASATLIPGGHSAFDLESYGKLAPALARAHETIDVFTDPTQEDVRLRNDLIAATSAANFADDRFGDAANAFVKYALGPDTGLQIVGGSEIQVLGQETALPVFIRNDLDRDATVVVTLRPSTGHITVQQSVEQTIPAGTSQRVNVPVQAITNGHTTASVTLATDTGVALAQRGMLNVTVRLQFEVIAMVVTMLAVTALITIGLYRTIRRIRQTRAEQTS